MTEQEIQQLLESSHTYVAEGISNEIKRLQRTIDRQRAVLEYYTDRGNIAPESEVIRALWEENARLLSIIGTQAQMMGKFPWTQEDELRRKEINLLRDVLNRIINICCQTHNFTKTEEIAYIAVETLGKLQKADGEN